MRPALALLAALIFAALINPVISGTEQHESVLKPITDPDVGDAGGSKVMHSETGGLHDTEARTEGERVRAGSMDGGSAKGENQGRGDIKGDITHVEGIKGDSIKGGNDSTVSDGKPRKHLPLIVDGAAGRALHVKGGVQDERKVGTKAGSKEGGSDENGDSALNGGSSADGFNKGGSVDAERAKGESLTGQHLEGETVKGGSDPLNLPDTPRKHVPDTTTDAKTPGADRIEGLRVKGGAHAKDGLVTLTGGEANRGGSVVKGVNNKDSHYPVIPLSKLSDPDAKNLTEASLDDGVAVDKGLSEEEGEHVKRGAHPTGRAIHRSGVSGYTRVLSHNVVYIVEEDGRVTVKSDGKTWHGKAQRGKARHGKVAQGIPCNKADDFECGAGHTCSFVDSSSGDGEPPGVCVPTCSVSDITCPHAWACLMPTAGPVGKRKPIGTGQCMPNWQCIGHKVEFMAFDMSCWTAEGELPALTKVQHCGQIAPDGCPTDQSCALRNDPQGSGICVDNTLCSCTSAAARWRKNDLLGCGTPSGWLNCPPRK